MILHQFLHILLWQFGSEGVGLDEIGAVMYVIAMFALLIIGGVILLMSYLRYWRYYKKGIMSIKSFIPIAGLGLLLFVLGVIMLVTW